MPKSNDDSEEKELIVDLKNTPVICNTTPYRRYLAQPRGYFDGTTGKHIAFDLDDIFFCTKTGINLLYTGKKIIFLFPYKIYFPGMPDDLMEYLKHLVASVYKTGYLGIEHMDDIASFDENKKKRIHQLYPILMDAYHYFLKKNILLFKWHDIEQNMMNEQLDFRFSCDEWKETDNEPKEQYWTKAQDETTLELMKAFFPTSQTHKTMEDYQALMKDLKCTHDYRQWCLRDLHETLFK